MLFKKNVCKRILLQRKRDRERASEMEKAAKHIWAENIWHFLVDARVCVSGFSYAFIHFIACRFGRVSLCYGNGLGCDRTSKLWKYKFHFSLLLPQSSITKSLFTFLQMCVQCSSECPIWAPTNDWRNGIKVLHGNGQFFSSLLDIYTILSLNKQIEIAIAIAIEK